MLDADDQAYARRFREQTAREDACPGHERLGTSTPDEARRGWHAGRCKHCGQDMNLDSGG